MTELEHVLSDIRNTCDALDIPADTVTAEFGPGQFEINFHHVPDALTAADHAMLVQACRLGRCRTSTGLRRPSCPSPTGSRPAAGMHMHVSLHRRRRGGTFSPAMTTSRRRPCSRPLGAVLSTMRELQAIFAPHSNSYRRFAPGSYAPTDSRLGYRQSWQCQHPHSRDIRARAPGSNIGCPDPDANPYLALAAVLGGILLGLRDGLDPGLSRPRRAAQPRHKLYTDLESFAVEGFARSAAAADIFSARTTAGSTPPVAVPRSRPCRKWSPTSNTEPISTGSECRSRAWFRLKGMLRSVSPSELALHECPW